MKKVIGLILFTGLLMLGYAQEMTNASAINKAGRQRMLSQRMTKDYLLIGAGIEYESAKKELDAAVALFERQFLELEDFAPTKEIENGLSKVSDLWMKFRMKIVSTPDIKDAKAIIKESTVLLGACNDVVKLIESYANVKSAKLVNMSGRQRMLSQRTAMFYTAYYWEVPDADLAKNFDKTMNEFSTALKTLIEAPENTPEISKILNKVKSQWDFSKKGFDLDSDNLMPSVVYVTTNSILKKMNKTTGLYQKVQEGAN
ncbi:MAG: pilus assembly protein PilP [Bacteroidetes bacterium]|nr:MAG: pilus assembly protein PilP [Bacteroidota bacterium]